MKKFLKILLVLVIALVLLLVAAAVAIPALVSGEDVKSRLSEMVRSETGRDLRIPGEVDISVFPWLGARLGRVELGNAAGFDAPLFASTDGVDVRVKLMPLLDRRVEMDTVSVQGLTLNLQKDANGRGNWEDLAAGGGGEGGAGSGAGGDGGGAAAALAIGGLDVSGATLNYSDAASGAAYAVKDLTFKTGPISSGAPIAIELGFDLAASEPPLEGRVTTSAEVTAAPDGSRVQATGIAVQADLQGPSLPGGSAQISLGADASYDAGAQSARLDNLVLKALDLAATGKLGVTGLGGEPAIAGELNVAPFDLRQILKALAGVEIATTDPAVLGRMAVKTGLSGTPSSVNLDGLRLELDDSVLSGKASVANFARPAVRFALKLDGINLDRYLPPGQSAPAASPGTASTRAAELPMEFLRGLDVVGTFDAGQVKVANLDMTAVSAKLDARKGVLKLSPITARLYDGNYSGNIALDARGEQPKLSLDESLQKVQLGPLLKDLQGDDPILGTANVKARLTGVGVDADRLMNSLNGQVSFSFLDGALKGVNIAKLIREAKAKLTGGTAAAGNEPNRTDFAEITGSAKVTNGVINNPDLTAKSPLLRIAGKGTASLPAQTVDYRATTTLVATSKGQGGKELDDLVGIPIPLRITGTFTQPEYGLDVQALGEALAKGKAKEVIEKQKAKVQEKVTEKLGEKAGKLLGGDKAGGGLLNNLLKN